MRTAAPNTTVTILVYARVVQGPHETLRASTWTTFYQVRESFQQPNELWKFPKVSLEIL